MAEQPSDREEYFKLLGQSASPSDPFKLPAKLVVNEEEEPHDPMCDILHVEKLDDR
jgi:hypothetical protein